MIDLYTFTTPNGRKASVMLEEIELPYNVHKIDITTQQQFTPEYIAINPKYYWITDGIRGFDQIH
ncbi:hypothetical protein [Nostoc sp. NMS4]|uniref:hypothetical protein n=1 Tax=Nostoc sp. NMS4 TaxID=2815390 RepID=UPI0025E7B3A3|nr:hypothetical protein [Nostoc sp. NMS4]